MAGHSSGYYSIDAQYNIIGFNDTAKGLYPNLVMGQKCYKVLMGLDSPCPPCPVANGIHGPKTYVDPIRKIYETVDAVETVLPDGSHGHALVFSTVEEGERLASSIPTGESALRLVGAINLLSNRYAVVLGVNLHSGRISVLRSNPLFAGSSPDVEDNMEYAEAMEQLIIRFVHPEERAAVSGRLNLAVLRERLAKEASFKVHCRILLDEIHYCYLLVARNGEAEDFEDFVVAIACEDDDINTQRIYEKQLENLTSSIAHVPGYFHLDITANQILKVGGRSDFVAGLDPNIPIDMLMQAMSAYILAERDRKDFMDAYCLEAMRTAYDSGKVEVIRESLCDYDDHIPRWSRYTVRLFINPSNSHLEGVFYGEDISKNKEEHETQNGIIQSLAGNYLDVLLLDVRANTASIIKSRSILTTGVEQTDSGDYPFDQLMGKYIRENVHPDDQERMRRATMPGQVQEQLAQEQEYEGTYRILRQGEARYYQFRFIRSPEYGSVVLGLMDIDKIVSKELEQQEKLQQALAEAKRANSEKSRFLARMSHDMRTPLNGILGLLEIDKKHPEDVEILRKNRQKAMIATSHLVSLINDVLDMAKIEEGTMTFANEPFDIAAEGRDATVLINLQAQEKGVETIVDFHPWDQRLNYVYGSPLHLRRALMNIYGNCIKYNREHGRINTKVQVIDYDDTHVTYRWIISDTGIGMSKEFLPKLFEPFTQEKIDSRSVYQGTGLGMSISKAIIEQMGGTLEVASEVNVGSTFTVTIPFRLADKSQVEQASSGERASVEGVRILLVEDNELNREIAQTLLLEDGAVVTTATNGAEAVELLERSPANTFDVVLMDVMMPVMDGYEATRVLREKGFTVPIIAMTANAFAEDVQLSLDAGMNAHIAKPIEVEKMLSTIARFAKP